MKWGFCKVLCMHVTQYSEYNRPLTGIRFLAVFQAVHSARVSAVVRRVGPAVLTSLQPSQRTRISATSMIRQHRNRESMTSPCSGVARYLPIITSKAHKYTV